MIQGTPEGRPGIWLIDADQAEALIHEKPGSTIHNFIDGGMALLGADWEKESAVALVHTEGKRCALVFPPNGTMKHQLVVLDDKKKWMFDVGEIEEARMKSVLPEGRIIFRFTPQPEDNITGVDDVGAEHVVVEVAQCPAGLMVYGKHPKTGEWIANYGERHVIKRLLEMMMRVHLQHDEPCRLDHHGFCQSHYCSEPCLYAEIKKALESAVLPV